MNRPVEQQLWQWQSMTLTTWRVLGRGARGGSASLLLNQVQWAGVVRVHSPGLLWMAAACVVSGVMLAGVSSIFAGSTEAISAVVVLVAVLSVTGIFACILVLMYVDSRHVTVRIGAGDGQAWHRVGGGQEELNAANAFVYEVVSAVAERGGNATT